jgi:uncharacterized protein YjbI with pentapeptide repeats
MAKFNYKKIEREVRDLASQRKEENLVFSSTHLQDLMGEDQIAQVIYDETSEAAQSGFFEFTEKTYRFTQFNGLMFGQDMAENESQLLSISDVLFYYCDFTQSGFSNMIFENCAFVGCNFTECYTMGFTTVFKACRFLNRVKGEANIDDAPSMFMNCELSAKFRDTDLSMTVFDKSHFYFSSFDQVNLKATIFLDSSFDTVNICDSDLRNTKILKPKFIEFYIEDKFQKSKVSRHTFLGEIDFNPKETREVRFASEVYSQLSELFEGNKLMELSGEYFYLFKKTESINLKGFEKFKSFIGHFTCGYGERPFFSLMTSMILVLTCGTLYMFFGVNANNEVIAFRPTLSQPFPPLNHLILWYHFSLVTFSTVGYGNVVPVGGSLIVSAFEMVLGIIMVGIWVSTLVRKMVR